MSIDYQHQAKMSLTAAENNLERTTAPTLISMAGIYASIARNELLAEQIELQKESLVLQRETLLAMRDANTDVEDAAQKLADAVKGERGETVTFAWPPNADLVQTVAETIAGIWGADKDDWGSYRGDAIAILDTIRDSATSQRQG